MTRKIPFVQEATLSLLDSLEEHDQYRDGILSLEHWEAIQTAYAVTSDERDVERRLPLLLTPTNESTALFDGIWLGVNTAHQDAANRHRRDDHHHGRRR